MLKQLGLVFEDTGLSPEQELYKNANWIYAKQIENPYKELDRNKIGKRMLFIPKNHIHDIWYKICEGVKSKNIWEAKVNPKSHLKDDAYVIIVYAYNFEDRKDVKKVLDYLTKNNLTLNNTIYYKTDLQTKQKIYAGNKERPWIYSSNSFLVDDLF